jgi:hypothetical protein
MKILPSPIAGARFGFRGGSLDRGGAPNDPQSESSPWLPLLPLLLHGLIK